MKKILIIILIILINTSAFAELFIPKGNEYLFEILRKNKIIGHHSFIFEKEEGTIKVKIDVNIQIKFGFITLYRYQHSSIEKWGDGELISIVTYTTTNSKKEYSLRGKQKNSFFEFNGVDGIKNTDKKVIPIDYWNKEIINKKEFLDSQKGIIRKIEIKEINEEKILFNNIEFIAKQYEINVKTKHPTDEKELSVIYVWYTHEGELLRLRFKSPEDKSIIEYKRKI